MITEACGCTHDGTSWIKKCDACQKADDEVAARWAAERNQPIEIKCHRLNGKVVSGVAPVVEPEEPIFVRKTPIVAAAAKAAGVAVVDIKMTPVEAKDMVGHTTPKAGTKLEQALEIYKGLKDRSRKNVIAIFVQMLNMTPAGASTYQHTCKQRLGV